MSLALPLLSPASLPVRQLPIPPPPRPNILVLHKFLMNVLKSPATSTHWWFNLLRQTNTGTNTCFRTFLAALTLHMQYSEGEAWRCWEVNSCHCQQLQDCMFFYPRDGDAPALGFYWLPVLTVWIASQHSSLTKLRAKHWVQPDNVEYFSNNLHKLCDTLSCIWHTDK